MAWSEQGPESGCEASAPARPARYTRPSGAAKAARQSAGHAPVKSTKAPEPSRARRAPPLPASHTFPGPKEATAWKSSAPVSPRGAQAAPAGQAPGLSTTPSQSLSRPSHSSGAPAWEKGLPSSQSSEVMLAPEPGGWQVVTVVGPPCPSPSRSRNQVLGGGVTQAVEVLSGPAVQRSIPEQSGAAAHARPTPKVSSTPLAQSSSRSSQKVSPPALGWM